MHADANDWPTLGTPQTYSRQKKIDLEGENDEHFSAVTVVN